MRFYLAGFLVLFITASYAQKKAKVYSGGDVNIIESSMQRVLPGQPRTPPYTRYNTILVWKNAQAPKSFFWYSGSEWMACSISKVHKTNNTPPPGNVTPWDAGYDQERIGLANIKKGDTLELTPQSAVKAPFINPSLFKQGNVFIVYQTKNKWLYSRVKAIKKQPDLALP